MGLFNRKPKEVEYNVQMQQPAPPPKVQKYTLAWAEMVASAQGFELGDDSKRVDGILGALMRRGGQCPCGGSGTQYQCPCFIMRDKGICKCGLYKSMPPRHISGATTTATIEPNE